MIHKMRIHSGQPRRVLIGAVLLANLLLFLLTLGVAVAAGEVAGYAWGTNAGWINFAPDNGGVTVYSDHLEGYAWGENIGWIRLGTCASGSPCTYANTAANNYGVNNNGVGGLSGYAWGTNIGWINFAPANGGVMVDPVTGDFAGYAWSENVGWIHFQNSSPAYKVNAAWRAGITPAYQNAIAALIYNRQTSPASSGGLTIANSAFLNDAGDWIVFGNNNAAFAIAADALPAGVDKRWARIWQLDVHDASSNGGAVTLTFDISDAGGNAGAPFSPSRTYFLLKRPTGSTGNFSVVTVVGWSVSGDQLTFTVNASNLGSEFTLGATAGSPTAVTLQEMMAASRPVAEGRVMGAILGGLLVLGLVGGLVAWRKH